MQIVFDEIFFFFNTSILNFLMLKKKTRKIKIRAKTNSGTRVENTLMQIKNIEGTRQIHFVTQG